MSRKISWRSQIWVDLFRLYRQFSFYFFVMSVSLLSLMYTDTGRLYNTFFDGGRSKHVLVYNN